MRYYNNLQCSEVFKFSNELPRADNFDCIFCSSALLCTHPACGEATCTQQLVSKAVVLQEERVLK